MLRSVQIVPKRPKLIELHFVHLDRLDPKVRFGLKMSLSEDAQSFGYVRML